MVTPEIYRGLLDNRTGLLISGEERAGQEIEPVQLVIPVERKKKSVHIPKSTSNGGKNLNVQKGKMLKLSEENVEEYLMILS